MSTKLMPVGYQIYALVDYSTALGVEESETTEKGALASIVLTERLHLLV